MHCYSRRPVSGTRKRGRFASLKGSIFGDNAQVHQGDKNVYVKYWRYPASSANEPSGAVQAQLEEKEKQDCRRSLGFRDIDARVQNISPTQRGTCDWFFKTSQFRQWYTRSEHDNGLFWIKGNPGTGKSTLMKRVLEYCQTKEDFVIAAYFFNARGNELEKTPLGMIRSLLFQLLKHEPALYDQLLPMFREKQKEYISEDWEWREPELKNFLLSEIPKCRSRPLLLIIDALDECCEDDVQKVAKFLQNLSTTARDANVTLNICLSSRHYPFIRFEKCQELVLEMEKKHDEDIAIYVRSNLTKRDKAIEEKIRKKASGIFMWVVLVITILNRAYDEGNLEAMNQKLNEIPADLGQVFEALLNKNNPAKEETILVLQCVLLAKRLLTPEELYFALIAGTNDQNLRPWDASQITPDAIRRRIVSSSRGLIEIRKGEKRTVQFIHGSVNDFLVRNGRLKTLDPALMPGPIAKSHDRLKDCCMSYIMMTSLKLPKNRQNATDIMSDYPFLQYASTYLLDHAEEGTLIGQTELLRALRNDGIFKRVEHLHNCFVDYEECGRRLNLLHILAARGLHTLAGIQLEWGADINAQGRPHGTALEAAIIHKHPKTVEILLNKGAKIDARGRLTHNTALQKAVYTNNKEILSLLIEKGATINIWETLRNSSVLHEVISNGNRDAVAMLLDKGAKINVQGFMGTALHVAAYHTEKEIVAMLLEKGADVNARGFLGTALHMAALGGEKEIVEMLLNKGAKVNSRGLIGTALHAAIMGESKEIVEMLLNKGAKVNVRGFMGTALQAAALSGEKEMVEMLIDKGAKVNARGLLGTSLQLAAMDGNKEVVEMLLDKGAEVNARGLLGTALQLAAFQGDKRTVEVLIERGAKVNARGLGTALQMAVLGRQRDVAKVLIDEGAKINTRGLMGTALQIAVFKGQKEMVRLLLDNGADINIKGGVFSVMHWVMEPEGKKEIIEMLLEKGAKVNSSGGVLNSALQVAASNGEKEMAKMLIDKGADINAWKGLQGTALQTAAFNGQKEMVELLIDKGAKINAWGGLLGTALQAAALGGEKDVVELLIDKGAKIDAWGAIFGTALQVAAFNGEKDIVEVLLNKGAKVNAWGGLLGSALQAAASKGKEEIVEVLLEKGAKESTWRGIYPIYNYLRGRDADSNTDSSTDEDEDEIGVEGDDDDDDDGKDEKRNGIFMRPMGTW